MIKISVLTEIPEQTEETVPQSPTTPAEWDIGIPLAPCSACGQETIASAPWQRGDILCSNCANKGRRIPWPRYIADPISLAGYPLRWDGLRWPERVSRSRWAVESWNWKSQHPLRWDESRLQKLWDEERRRLDRVQRISPLSLCEHRGRVKGALADRARPYNPDFLDIMGAPIWPTRHGITGWMRSNKPGPSDQDIKLRFVTQHGPVYGMRREVGGFDDAGKTVYVDRYKHVGSQVFTYRDVIKSKLHRDEVLELEKGRHLKVKGNTGGWRPLRADEDFMEWAAAEGTVDNREVVDTLNAAEKEQRFYVEMQEDIRSGISWDGEEFQMAEDREYFPGQVFARGRDRNKTDEERFEMRVEKDKKWNEKTQPLAQAIIKSGVCDPTPNTKPEDIVTYNGIKIDKSSPTFKHIQYEVALNKGEYDTKKELAGKHYESFRKKELEERMKPEIPKTKFTPEQSEDLKNGGVYAHIVLDRGRWFKLDMTKHRTYQAAIHEIWSKSIDEAFKKAHVPSRRTDLRTPESDPELAQAFKEVAFRYNTAFRPENIYIMDGREPRTAVAITEVEWEDGNAD
jgi:hypothetical protein